MTSGKRCAGIVGLALLGLLAGCAETTAPTTSSRPAPTTTEPGRIVVSPEFIQGAIPGAEVVLLVAQTDESAGRATVTASAEEAEVTVEPTTITGTDVAEVTVIPAATTTEAKLSVTIVVETDQGSQSTTKTATVFPWEDDREDQGVEILGLFTHWLAVHRPELAVTPEAKWEGTYLAPGLLVVSHYGFFNEEWELGVSWHVMVPPDDFAEIYLRPRSELRPTLAFRIGSWQTALDTGDYEVSEVGPPAEVVR